MSALAILVVLVSGFIFTNQYPLAKFKQLRATGWDSYFHVTAWGVFFSCVSGFLYLIIENWKVFPSALPYLGFSSLKTLSNYLSAQESEVRFAGWSLLTLGLALLLGWLSANQKFKDKASVEVAAENEFESLLFVATVAKVPILITLGNNKVYVGFAVEQSSKGKLSKTEFVSILPLMSGYRHKETLAVEFNLDYSSFFENIDQYGGWEKFADRFNTVIPTCEIVTLSFFDMDVYRHIQGAAEPTGEIEFPGQSPTE